jgi:hypothetical protein
MHEHQSSAGGAAGPSVRRPDERPELHDEKQHEASHSMWLMLLCCIPMVLIFVAILLGAFGAR